MSVHSFAVSYRKISMLTRISPPAQELSIEYGVVKGEDGFNNLRRIYRTIEEATGGRKGGRRGA